MRVLFAVLIVLAFGLSAVDYAIACPNGQVPCGNNSCCRG